MPHLQQVKQAVFLARMLSAYIFAGSFSFNGIL